MLKLSEDGISGESKASGPYPAPLPSLRKAGWEGGGALSLHGPRGDQGAGFLRATMKQMPPVLAALVAV